MLSGVEFGLQIGNNQSGATLGAEGDLCKKMTEGPTQLTSVAPSGAWALG